MLTCMATVGVVSSWVVISDGTVVCSSGLAVIVAGESVGFVVDRCLFSDGDLNGCLACESDGDCWLRDGGVIDETDGDGLLDGEIDGEGLLDGETEGDGLLDGEIDGDGLLDGEIDRDGPLDGEIDWDGLLDGEIEGDGLLDGDGEEMKGFDCGVDCNSGSIEGDGLLFDDRNCSWTSTLIGVKDPAKTLFFMTVTDVLGFSGPLNGSIGDLVEIDGDLAGSVVGNDVNSVGVLGVTVVCLLLVSFPKPLPKTVLLNIVSTVVGFSVDNSTVGLFLSVNPLDLKLSFGESFAPLTKSSGSTKLTTKVCSVGLNSSFGAVNVSSKTTFPALMFS